MAHYQIRKTTKPYRCLFDLRNIHKPKVEHLINARLLHQLQEDYENVNSSIKFPFQNIEKTVNDLIDSHSMTMPLSINHQMNNTVGGNRMYLEKYPSVTTILSNTKPRNEYFGLMNWRKSNIEKFGEKRFGLMQKDTFMKGNTFHQDMKEYFTKSTTSLHCKIQTSGFIKSVYNILPNISNPLAVESSVVHSDLAYAGTVDLVAEYMGKLSVIDWKTSRKKRVNLSQCHSYPIQVSAYAGAINFDPDYPFQISSGVLVIAYENGDPADVLIMNKDVCEEYWQKWLARLHQYNAMKSEDSLKTKKTKWTIAEGQYLGISMNLNEKLPEEEICKGTKTNGNRHNLKPFSLLQLATAEVNQNGGRPLSEIGRIVKDEEILATWRNLASLTECILGRAYMSKGLFMIHDFKTTIRSILKIFKNKNLIFKKNNQ